MDESTEYANTVVSRVEELRSEEGHRPMSDRERDRLARTTADLHQRASQYAAAANSTDPENALRGFQPDFIRRVQAYYRDEWYDLTSQVQYLQILRGVSLTSVTAEHAARMNQFYDQLTLWAVEACARPV